MINKREHMKKQKKARHISIPFTGDHLFPPLQERILLCLAEKNPQTINEAVKAMKGSYKSTWLAFNSLEEKKIIAKVSSKLYRGREYPCFWLTPDGSLAALLAGAHAPTMLEKSIKIYPEDSGLPFLLEAIPVIGTSFLSIALGASFSKGRIEDSDVALILASQAQTGLSPEQKKQLAKILKKYPSQRERVRQAIQNARKKLDELEADNDF
jgi:hypothetical protein